MTNRNCYQLFESELNRSATSLSIAAQYRQTCSKLIQFRLKKLVAIFVHHSTALVCGGWMDINIQSCGAIQILGTWKWQAFSYQRIPSPTLMIQLLFFWFFTFFSIGFNSDLSHQHNLVICGFCFITLTQPDLVG